MHVFHRRPAIVLAIIMVIAGLVGTVRTGSVVAQSTNSGLPLAHGVSALFADGSGNGAWRVVRDSAPPSDEAQSVERALGFTLADQGPILVESDTTGTSTVIPLNGADFVYERDVESRSSLSDTAVSYLRIALVLPSEVNDVANGELVFAGESFAIPDGPRALSLQGYQLQQDETLVVPTSDAPALIVVTSGALVDESGAAIQAGTAVSAQSGTTFQASTTDTMVAIGLIGERIDNVGGSTSIAPAPVASPVPPGNGEAVEHAITVVAVDCTNGDRTTLENCEPMDGVTFSVARGSQTTSSETAVSTDSGGTAQFTIPDTMTLTVRYLSGAPEGLSPVESVVTVEHVSQAEQIIFVFVPSEQDTNTLTINALDCTAGDPETRDGCIAMPDVTFVVTAGDDTSSAENGHTTGVDGLVTLDIPSGYDVTVTYQSGASEGLAPLTATATHENLTEDITLTFVFVPIG